MSFHVPDLALFPGQNDADLISGILPIPEVRETRSNPHTDRRKLMRETFYTSVREILKRRRRLIPGHEFQYTKLGSGEIRLISLRPYGSPELAGSPLFASILTRRLEAVKGRFEALSYVWGDQNTKPNHEIRLRNVNHTLPHGERNMMMAAAMAIKYYPFPIYKNLYDALMRLRGMRKDVIIWVDAICIDQSERGEAEKRQQLQMMDKIYESAFNVCIWLGGGFSGSANGIQLAREINNLQKFDKLLANVATEQRWRELIRLLKLPWFGRRWIIQEIAHAHNASLHCGTDGIHWSDFAEAVSLVLDSIELLRKNVQDEIFEDIEMSSGSALIAILSTAKTCDLETLVSTLLGFHATFPRDTIFSVISIARDPPIPDEPWEQALHLTQIARLGQHAINQGFSNTTDNLGASLFFKYQLSTRDIYIAFITRTIYNSGSLDIICRHWAPPVFNRFRDVVAMPSWISPIANSPFPFTGAWKGRQNSDNLVAYTPSDRRKRYNAAGFSEAEITMEDDMSSEFVEAHPLIGPISTSSMDSFDARNSAGLPFINFAPQHLAVPQLIHPQPEHSIGAEADRDGEATNANGTTTSIGPANENTHMPLYVQSPNSPVPESPISLSPAAATRHPRSFARSRAGSLLQKQQSLSIDLEGNKYLSGVMSVQGFVIGRVRDASDVMRAGIVPGAWIQRLGWTEDDSNRVPDVLWRTLVADRTAQGGHPPPWYHRACLHVLNDTRKTDLDGNLHPVTPPGQEISEHSTMYLRRVESVVWNRRLFSVNPEAGSNFDQTLSGTIKGRLVGVGPSGTAAGQRVCILLGCSVPVILGEGTRRGLSRIVGEAYVHGIMNGEAMRLNTVREKFLLE